MVVFALVGANDAGWASERALGLFAAAATLASDLPLAFEARVAKPLVQLASLVRYTSPATQLQPASVEDVMYLRCRFHNPRQLKPPAGPPAM